MTKSIFKQFEEDTQAALTEGIGDSEMSDDKLSVFVAEVLEESTKSLLEQMKSDAVSMLRAKRRSNGAFEKRNSKRWNEAFDLFEMMIVISQELGELADKEFRSKAQSNSDYKFEAISHLYPRAVLICNEIFCLLKGGFPDAALSRWRSLHEINVTAAFIKEAPQSVALKYLANFDFQALKASENFNLYAERAGAKPFDDAEIAALKARCASLERQIGVKLKDQYDWALEALSVKKASFKLIETSVQMDHWHPRYEWACQHIHAGHRPPDRMLGLSESKQPMFLVGPSNSGFIDPLQMAAMSLAQITSTFVLFEPTLMGAVMANIMSRISDELGPLAYDIETKTLSDYKLRNS